MDKALQNRQQSVGLYCIEISLFNRLDDELNGIIRHLLNNQTLFKPRCFTPISLFALVSRQFRSGFGLVLQRQPWDGFAVVRIAVESIAYGYKMLIKPELIDVYHKRGASEADSKKYREAFERNLFLDSLPGKDDLKTTRKLINENWSHPDRGYFSQAVSLVKDEIIIYEFEMNDQWNKLHLLHMISCYWECLYTIRNILNDFAWLPHHASNVNSSWSLLCTDIQEHMRIQAPQLEKLNTE